MTDGEAPQNGPASGDEARPGARPARPAHRREPETTQIPASMALTPEAELLDTDQLAAIEAKKEAAEPDPPAVMKWWNRFNHIYRTRVRTTTVILVLLFFVGLAMYGCTTSYYGEAPTPPAYTRPAEPTSEHTPASTSHEPSHETSEPSEPRASDESGTPSSPTTTHWYDRLPGRGTTPTTQTPSPQEETESPTGSVPAQ